MIIADIVRHACLNPEFRQRFQQDPRGCLRELGYLINDDIELKILEDTPKVMHVILPIDGWGLAPAPQEADVMVSPGSGVCDSSASSHTCCYVTPPDAP